ncbi:MAG: FKBP-type peptidyl-prolyl cis-trans isomerase [Prevotella sp.]|nr:FKBP-type peptidyl-prolyl cis-trans isomerase [Prevotella sp.]
MKNVYVLALAALVAGASFNTAEAAKKKKQKKQVAIVETLAPVVLTTGSDSMSYAGGMTLTIGLVDYLQQQMKVDTAYMADFVKGFNETVNDTNDPREMARRAGRQIAEQVKQGMLPRMKKDFEETPDGIIDSTLFRGFADALNGDSTIFTAAKAEEFFKQKQLYNQQARKERLSKPGRDFLARNAQEEGVITTPSGLQYKVLVKGEGKVPQRTDKVKVHYEGRLIDGTVFDASSKHGTEPVSFQPTQVIRGWTEALTMMPVGSKWRLFIPQELAYGERQTGNIPPYSALIFDVELVGIE